MRAMGKLDLNLIISTTKQSTPSTDLLRKHKNKIAIPCMNEGPTHKSLAKSINGNVYSNAKIEEANRKLDKRPTVRELDIRMKQVIK